MDLSNDDSSGLLEFAKKLARLGGKEALKYFRQPSLKFQSKLEQKLDPISIADRNAEKLMRKLIKKYRPRDGITGEEFADVVGKSEYTWVLDPIDGTRAFISGQTSWTVLVSLNIGSNQIFGLIYSPVTDEMFIGEGNSAFVVTKKKSSTLKVRKCRNLADAISHTTDPEMGTQMENAAMRRVRSQCLLSRYSMDAYAYGLLAAGHLDLVIECSMRFYDLQAPMAVIKAAGGFFTDWQGGQNFTHGQVLVSSDRRLHDQALSLLSDY